MLFKTFSAVLLLSSSSLGFVTQGKTVLPGFHITIKSNNANDIFINDNWNKMNDTYQNFIRNDVDNNLLTVKFDDWSQIINQDTNNNIINQTIYNNFENQINNDKNQLKFLKDNEKKFGTQAIGRSIANINFDPNSPITSFGSVYIPYYDSLKTKINNGLFAKIYPEYNFSNYFSVPYMIQPSDSLLNNSSIYQRIKIIPINGSRDALNERQLVILAKQPGEKLLINGSGNKVFNSKNLAYAILDHDINKTQTNSEFNISVTKGDSSDPIYKNKINLTNTTSMIQFITNNTDTPTILNHDYLVFNDDKNKQNLIVMNEAKESAKVNLFGNTSWVKYKVDPKTLTIDFTSGSSVDPSVPLAIDNIDDSYQVYYLQQETTGTKNLNNQKVNNSGQYLVVYKDKCPNFNNWTNLNSDNNSLLVKGFQQYLSVISTDMPLNELEKNASQFINYFINYQQDLKNYNFVNYFGNDKTKPWDLTTKAHEVTLLSNWKVIIISIVMILFLILIIPLAIFLLKKEKRLK